MIKNIKNINRSMFKCLNFNSTTENPSKDTHAYISIYGTELDEQPAPKINHSLWADGIQLMFDDVEKDDKHYGLKVISETQADEIIDFVSKIHHFSNEITLIIHCHAGISRSAAVGKFVNDFLNVNLQNYTELDFFNFAVYRKLIKRLAKRATFT